MKTFFEEPVIRVERFTAESVMEGPAGTFDFLSGLTNYEVENDRTHGIFARPY